MAQSNQLSKDERYKRSFSPHNRIRSKHHDDNDDDADIGLGGILDAHVEGIR